MDVGQNLHRHWENDAGGQLATIIICDQFSRRIFRGQAESFSFDHIALRITKSILKKPDYFREYKLFEKLYVIMPLLHTENIDDCQLGIDVLE